MVNASYLEAAVKHKQTKKGSLGTELAPHADYKSIEAGCCWCTKREMSAFDALNSKLITNMWGRKVTNLITFQHSIVK